MSDFDVIYVTSFFFVRGRGGWSNGDFPFSQTLVSLIGHLDCLESTELFASLTSFGESSPESNIKVRRGKEFDRRLTAVI